MVNAGALRDGGYIVIDANSEGLCVELRRLPRLPSTRSALTAES
jgi:hypothetical protein